MKLNGLKHSKIVLVKDHVEYERKKRQSDHSNLIRRSLLDRCYGTWETVQKIWCHKRKIGKNRIKKVKLNGLIHAKIVLVEDHVEYEKKQENPIIQIL